MPQMTAIEVKKPLEVRDTANRDGEYKTLKPGRYDVTIVSVKNKRSRTTDRVVLISGMGNHGLFLEEVEIEADMENIIIH